MRASPPTIPPAFPPGIRFAQPGDEPALFAFCLAAHADNGWGGLDRTAVAEKVAKGAARRGGIVFGVIPGEGDSLKAAIGLEPTKLWYGDADSWFWQELLIYVRPDHRRSRHFSTLMRFAQWFEHVVRAPVALNLMPASDYERKRRAFARYGREVGASFLIGDGTFRYAQKQEAA